MSKKTDGMTARQLSTAILNSAFFNIQFSSSLSHVTDEHVNATCTS